MDADGTHDPKIEVMMNLVLYKKYAIITITFIKKSLKDWPLIRKDNNF